MLKNIKTIRNKIMSVTVVLLAAALILVGGVSSYINYSSTLSSLEQTMTESVKIAANQVTTSLDIYRALAEEAALNEAIKNNDKNVVNAILGEMAREHGYIDMGRTDSQGRTYKDGSDISHMIYYSSAKADNSSYVGTPEVSNDGKNIFMMLSAPITIEGKFDGIIYIQMDADFLSELVANISIGKTGNASIISENGNTIAYADRATVLMAYNTQKEAQSDSSLERLASLEQTMLQGSSGFASYSYGGVEKFMAYAPIHDTNGWGIYLSVVQSEFLNSTYMGIWITVILAAVILIIGTIIIIGLAKTISVPVKLCSDRLQLLAEGDVTSPVPEIHSRDETGVLAASTITLVNGFRNIIQDETWLLDQMAKGNFNVDSRAEQNYIGDFSPILTAFKEITHRLSGTLSQINAAADQVASGSDQVASGSQALSQGATEQASSIEELAATINEISNQVMSNAENAQQANKLADDVGIKMTESNQQMQNMIEAMKEISGASGEIGKIIKTIEDIAFQTNILALNAAVEAARAGEAGKGFAVVADEVRNLASKSAEASKNTAVLIESSILAVKKGTKIADETAHALLESVEGAQQVTKTIDQISRASEEQASSINQVTQGIDQISSVVQTNSATAEESAAASEQLSGQSQLLKTLISQFELKDAVSEQEEMQNIPEQAEQIPAYSDGGKY